jgi:Tol biopolymer transport system component/DNA-binding winged helix-turn-helix (wHTH) protein
VRFGVFELDLRAGELRRGGFKVKLQEQPFQILTLLLERPGDLVTYDEVIQALWPDGTVVEYEHSVKTAVGKLRQALGDDAGTPRYIETLPRRGYRFIYPLSEGGQGLKPSPHDQVERIPLEVSADRTAQSPIPWRVLAPVAIFLILALGYLLRPPLHAPTVSGFAQLTHDAATKYLAGTDGSRIYIWEPGTNRPSSMVQVSVAGGQVVPVPAGSPSMVPLSISPDGSELLAASEQPPGSSGPSTVDFLSGASSRDGGESGPLWAFPTSGGSPWRLGDAVGGDGAWSPDMKTLIYAENDTLYLAKFDGTASRELVSVPGAPADLTWSPDGGKIRFTIARGTEPGLAWEISPSGKNPRPIFGGWTPKDGECCGSWTPDRNYFVFESGGQIWARRETGSFLHRVSRMPVQLTGGAFAYQDVLPSKDGKKLFAVEGLPRGELDRYDVFARAFVPYLGGISAEGVSFSRDGQSIAYVSYPEGTLWRARTDGSERQQLSFPPIYAFLPRWSPDGEEIAFTGFQPGRPSRMYLIASHGGTPHEAMPNVDVPQADSTWSPDGKSVVFSWDFGSDSSTIRILNLGTHQVSTVAGSRGLFGSRWSPDGRYIYAETDDGMTLKLFDVYKHEWSDLATLANTGAGFPSWSLDSKYVYFVQVPADPAVMRVRIRDRKLEKVVS